jgi:hypothetical protein
MVPPSFIRQCESVVDMFHLHLKTSPGKEELATRSAQVVQAFTWFMMDGREMTAAPATKDELVARFREWYVRNVHGGPPSEEIVTSLDMFFQFVEEKRLAAIRL